MHQRDISEVNAILDIDETDHVTGQKLFEGQDPEALYNMSTDIFIVDTPWLIEKLEQEVHKEHPEKLRYILRDLAVEYGAFAFEYTGYIANIHSVESYYRANLDMLETQKFMSLFSPNQKVYTKVKMKSQLTMRLVRKLRIRNLPQEALSKLWYMILSSLVGFISIRGQKFVAVSCSQVLLSMREQS